MSESELFPHSPTIREQGFTMNNNMLRLLSRRAVLGATAIGATGYALSSIADSAPNPPAAPVSSTEGVIHFPARDIPMPESISAGARAYLTQLARMPSLPGGTSDQGDVDALRKRIAAFDSALGGYYASLAAASNTSVKTETMNGVTVFVATRNEATSEERRKVHLYIHGGGFIEGGGNVAMYSTQLEARRYGGTTVGVDYRMAPDHPFPAALDDCLAVYQALLYHHAAWSIFVSGESAGGNLSAALMHKARDAHLPPPGALFLFTPVTDMAVLGDSRQVNLHADVVLKGGAGGSDTFYVNGADLTSPYLSPLRGELAHVFPPTYLRTGTRDLLLSDTVRMHAALRKAGVEADLYVGEAMPHSGFPDNTPEQADAIADTVRWLERHWHL
jgi:acetyl esterase/lipase